MFWKQGEESRDDQSPPGSHHRDCGEHPFCEGVRLGGCDGDHHQEHQTVRHKNNNCSAHDYNMGTFLIDQHLCAAGLEPSRRRKRVGVTFKRLRLYNRNRINLVLKLRERDVKACGKPDGPHWRHWCPSQPRICMAVIDKNNKRRGKRFGSLVQECVDKYQSQHESTKTSRQANYSSVEMSCRGVSQYPSFIQNAWKLYGTSVLFLYLLCLCSSEPSCHYRDEMTLTRKIGSLRYFYSASYFFSAILVIVSAIVPHALSKGIILRRIFTTASYCMVLRMTLTRQLPGSVQMWYDTLALVKKIEVGSDRLQTCTSASNVNAMNRFNLKMWAGQRKNSHVALFFVFFRNSCWKKNTECWSTTWPPQSWSWLMSLLPGMRFALKWFSLTITLIINYSLSSQSR